MRASTGNVEVLMLLCCLVGVVAFFSLSLAFSSSLYESAGGDDLVRVRERLTAEKEEKEKLAADLQRRKKSIENEMMHAGNSTADSQHAKAVQIEQLEKELAKLLQERDRLIARFEALRRELEASPPLSGRQNKEDKQKELADLQKKLEELDARIRKAESLVTDLSRASGGSSQEETVESLKKAVESSQKDRKELEKNVNDLKLKVLIGGNSKFDHPLFTECKKDGFIIYPQGQLVSVAELEKQNIFKEKAGAHDIAVFFVRPDGFASFHSARKRVGETSLALSYEPVEANQSLDYLKELKR
jgi:hypothetical protein